MILFLMRPALCKEKFLVVIDPGHGGNDTGALYKNGSTVIPEKTITLALAQHLAQALRAQGIAVKLTRTTDTDVGLDRRATMANTANATVFVSLHTNSSIDHRFSGFEAYVLNTTTNASAQRLAAIENGRKHQSTTLSLILSDLETTANYTDSVALACSLQQNLRQGLTTGRLPFKDRGVKQALLYVLMQTHMPSVLLEVGFASNPQELARLLNPQYRALMARGLAQGVVSYKQKQFTKGTKVSALQKQAACHMKLN